MPGTREGVAGLSVSLAACLAIGRGKSRVWDDVTCTSEAVKQGKPLKANWLNSAVEMSYHGAAIRLVESGYIGNYVLPRKTFTDFTEYVLEHAQGLLRSGFRSSVGQEVVEGGEEEVKDEEAK